MKNQQLFVVFEEISDTKTDTKIDTIPEKYKNFLLQMTMWRKRMREKMEITRTLYEVTAINENTIL